MQGEIKIHVVIRDLLYLFKYCKNASIFEKYLILLTYNLLIINIETGEQRILCDYFNSDFNLGEGGKDYVFSDFVIHKNGYGQSFLIALIQNVINNDKNLITFKIQFLLLKIKILNTKKYKICYGDIKKLIIIFRHNSTKKQLMSH